MQLKGIWPFQISSGQSHNSGPALILPVSCRYTFALQVMGEGQCWGTWAGPWNRVCFRKTWSCESIRLSSVMQWSLRNRLQSHKNRGNPEKIQKTDEPPSNSAVQHHERKRMGLFGLRNNVIFQRQMDNTALVPLLGLLCHLVSKICLCPPSKSLWRWLNAACPSLATAMETARDIPRWKSHESPVTWMYRLDQGLWFSASHTCHQLVPVAQHHKKPHLFQEDDYFLKQWLLLLFEYTSHPGKSSQMHPRGKKTCNLSIKVLLFVLLSVEKNGSGILMGKILSWQNIFVYPLRCGTTPDHIWDIRGQHRGKAAVIHSIYKAVTVLTLGGKK